MWFFDTLREGRGGLTPHQKLKKSINTNLTPIATNINIIYTPYDKNTQNRRQFVKKKNILTQKKDTIYLWICISKHYSILCLSSQYKPKNTKPKQFPRIPKNIFATNTTKRNSLIENFSLKLHCKKKKNFSQKLQFSHKI